MAIEIENIVRSKENFAGTENLVGQDTGGGVDSSFKATLNSLVDWAFKKKNGWFNLHPSDFMVPRYYLAANGWEKVTNDGAGPASSSSPPKDITSVFDTINGQLDFSQLSIGDEFLIRIDIDFVTTANNQEVLLRAELGIGGTPYTISLGGREKKSIGIGQLGILSGGPLPSVNTKNLPAEIQIWSDADLSYTVQMIYISVKRG